MEIMERRASYVPPVLFRHMAALPHISGLLVFLAILMLTMVGPAFGEDRVMVQDITGHMKAGESVLYRLSKLAKGDTLYVHVKGTSGNFDPMVVLLKPGTDFEKVRQLFDSQLEKAIAEGEDPLAASRDILEKFSLALKDDMDGKYDSALQFKVPADGNYTLLVASALGYRTFGNYRFLAGVNAPEVLTGKASPTGQPFVSMDRIASRIGKGVEEVKGTLTRNKYLRLVGINAGDTLYVYVEATSGDLKPVVTLYDFGDKALVYANFTGEKTAASLKYRFPRFMKNCRVMISGKLRDKTVTTGDYRALIGVNAPEVITGAGEVGGNPILEKPVPVKIGIKMQQISDVNQKSENFGIVATLMMRWDDPTLAFRPDKAVQERVKVYTGESFTRKMTEEGNIWPQFSIYNQQGNRWIQNSVVVVFSEGRALYMERFSVTLQAPDFNFRKFPFDKQRFFIKVDSIFPERFFVFENLEGFSEVGKQLGEEEWMVSGFETTVDRTDNVAVPDLAVQLSFRSETSSDILYFSYLPSPVDHHCRVLGHLFPEGLHQARGRIGSQPPAFHRLQFCDLQ